MRAAGRLLAACLVAAFGSALVGAEGKEDPRALTIGEAVVLARRASVQVRAEAAAAEAALRAVGAAKAAYLPKISASASGAWLANPPKGMTITANSIPLIVTDPLSSQTLYGRFPPVDLSLVEDTKPSYFSGQLGFSQPLYAWGKIAAGVALASLGAELAEARRSGSELDAARAAKRSYDAALLARGSKDILVELRDLASSIASDRRLGLEEGRATRADVLSAEADLAELESRLVQAEEGEASALEGLAFLTGLDAGELRRGKIALVSGFRPSLPSFDETTLKDGAPPASTEWTAARIRLAQAGRKLDLERGSAPLLPDLALFARLEASGQVVPFSEEKWYEKTWSWGLSLGLRASVELFDGGASAARLAEARASLEAARTGLEGSEAAARLALRRAIDAARGSAAILASREARAAWTAETLRNARSSAEAGMASRAELNGAAILDAGARLELLAARASLAEAVAELERLAGRELP